MKERSFNKKGLLEIASVVALSIAFPLLLMTFVLLIFTILCVIYNAWMQNKQSTHFFTLQALNFIPIIVFGFFGAINFGLYSRLNNIVETKALHKIELRLTEKVFCLPSSILVIIYNNYLEEKTTKKVNVNVEKEEKDCEKENEKTEEISWGC